MRAIGRLQSGQWNGCCGTLLSQFDEPGCLNDFRRAKQAKWTLLRTACESRVASPPQHTPFSRRLAVR